MSAWYLLLLLPALAQEPRPEEPTALEQVVALPSPEEPPSQEPEEPATPEAWTPPEDPDLRNTEGLPLLGPWPDGHLPEGPVQRAWPLIDIRSGKVLQPGQPYGQAEGALGPLPPQGLVSGQETPPDDPQARSPAPLSPGSTVVEGAPLPPQAGLEDNPSSPPAAGLPLPKLPPRDPLRALWWLAVGLVATVIARIAPRLMANLQGAGALPFLWRATGLTARLVAVISGFAVVIYALPDGIRGLVPWLLVGLALSAGLATLGLFRDLLALIVLSLERRVVPGGQIRIGNLTGQIVSLSPRAVTLRTGDGTEVRVPNWRFLSRSVHLDRDPRAFVEFRLKISSQAPRERVHRVLEELLLLSPYAVVSGEGRPGVRPDPDDLTTWWVEARLLDARWTRDFERTLVEMANERLEN